VITYEPVKRPEVSNLLLLTSLSSGDTPEQIAEEIGDRGASELKRRLTESVNEYFRSIRQRRLKLADNMDFVWSVLRMEMSEQTMLLTVRLMLYARDENVLLLGC